MTKFFENKAVQGDIYIRRIASLPDGIIRVIPENGVVVIAHSETGHHHVMDADKVEMYRLSESIVDCFIVVKEETSLRHLRNYDTHEDIHHRIGTYHVRRQREHVVDWRNDGAIRPLRITRVVLD